MYNKSRPKSGRIKGGRMLGQILLVLAVIVVGGLVYAYFDEIRYRRQLSSAVRARLAGIEADAKGRRIRRILGRG